MDKPKFKMSVDELLQFNDDCIEAALQCPQNRLEDVQVFEDRQILRKEVSAKEVVKWWRSCSTLWEYGYHKCLTEEALDVFKKYEIYKAEKKIWKYKNKGKEND